jgi:carbamoyltransferase
LIVLGLYGALSGFEHDPGAAIVIDGVVRAVCEEERYLRVKSAWGRLPLRSIRACLSLAGCRMEDVDVVVHPGEVYDDLPERIRRYLVHHFGTAPTVEIVHHQTAHLASAWLCSGFEDDAMCLSYDGYGDGVSVALAHATHERGIEVLVHEPRQRSLGVLYSAITSYLGFQVAEDEYKVMGLAPLGRAGAVDLSPFVGVDGLDYEIHDHTFRAGHLQLSGDEPIYGDRLVEVLGPPRMPGTPIEQRHMDIARAAQDSLSRVAAALVTRLHAMTGSRSLCIAGGVGLNCTVNWSMGQLPCVDRLFVQPAASDRGLALGAALHTAFGHGDLDGPIRLATTAYGSEYGDEDAEAELVRSGLRWCRVDDPAAVAAELLAQGAIVGWYQGRSEFGPRALGHRSILADPRRIETRDRVNDAIKFRESFRPFAPSVLAERSAELLEFGGASPFMTMSVPVREKWQERLGAVTHVDGTARVQTVDQAEEPLYHRLIAAFAAATDVPAVLNTSFNVQGQPIVESPRDALATFAGSGLDAVLIGRTLVRRDGA